MGRSGINAKAAGSYLLFGEEGQGSVDGGFLICIKDAGSFGLEILALRQTNGGIA